MEEYDNEVLRERQKAAMARDTEVSKTEDIDWVSCPDCGLDKPPHECKSAKQEMTMDQFEENKEKAKAKRSTPEKGRTEKKTVTE